jgi:hypothetical protein
MKVATSIAMHTPTVLAMGTRWALAEVARGPGNGHAAGPRQATSAVGTPE